MNLDQQLRAALSQEADMQNAPAPDVDTLILGGKERQRRRSLTRIGVAAALAVLVAGGVYGVVKDSETSAGPTNSPHTTTPKAYRDTGNSIEPGTYRMLVGIDATDAPISADITFGTFSHDTFDTFWQAGNYPVLPDATSWGGLAVYQPLALAAGTGCLGDQPNASVDQTPQALANQLAQLPRATVLQAATPVQAFGREAVHLQVRINANCHESVYRVANTVNGNHGISYGLDRPVVIDFWAVKVSGVPVVVESWHQNNASPQLVDQIARTTQSITFVTGR